ncbi:MAG: formylglycine-generating enzyme family protein [Candidatus Competibacter sp.]|nr:formylglycine-generating enzyme family protein [Candidatus Competibacter sp.]
MRGGWGWMVLGMVLGLAGGPVRGADPGPNPEEVRKLMKEYERRAAPPAPKPAPAPKPKPKPKPPPVEVESAPVAVAGGPDMVKISGGCFQMGSPENEPDRGVDERQHQVCVRAFEIGRYEVTQRQWQAVMGNNPSEFQGCADCPVENVSWNDVRDYLARLNGRTGGTYRLPSEAEWEYACRGGVAGQRYCGGDDEDRVAWYYGNSGNKTHSVGRKAANGYGLYDMSGNVWEWTCSLYDSDYGGAEKECTTRDTPGARAVRGGSWDDLPAWVRSAYRLRNAPPDRDNDAGFRLARSL